MGMVNGFNMQSQPQGPASPFAMPSGMGGGLPFFQNMNMGGSPFGMASMGMPGMSGDPLAQLGLQSMTSDTRMLFMSLTTMMVGVMSLITSVLAGILSGAISGKAPAGNTPAGNPAPGEGNNGNVNGNQPPGSGMQPNAQGFVLPLAKQYIKKPSDGGDFGPRAAPTAGASTDHKGNDFGAPAGAEIYAVKEGTIKVIPNNGGAGNTVEVDHGNGLVTRYFHMSKFASFKTGDKVKAGDVIGFVGTTGTSTGNHLHFEVHQNGKPVDPWPFLQGLI